MSGIVRHVFSLSLALTLSHAAFAASGPANIALGQAPDADYTKAQAAIREKNWEGAIESLNRMLIRLPNSADV